MLENILEKDMDRQLLGSTHHQILPETAVLPRGVCFHLGAATCNRLCCYTAFLWSMSRQEDCRLGLCWVGERLLQSYLRTRTTSEI